jgi:hypothetical protein
MEHLPSPAGAPALTFRDLLGGAGRLALVWLVFGAVIGSLLGQDGGAIGTISFAIAGALVMPWLGACLGFMGGRCRETIAGAAAGALIGTVLGIGDQPLPPSVCLNLGLIVGGIIGANYSALRFWKEQIRRPAVS